MDKLSAGFDPSQQQGGGQQQSQGQPQGKGGQGQAGFESAMFSLAYEKLQDKLPSALDSLVGFEVVKKSENNQKAVGVFGFKSPGGQVLFVPVFFRSGAVQPLDLLYSKESSQFYPLNEDWMKVFLAEGSGQPGEKSTDDKNSLRREMPMGNLRDLVVPPRTGKYTYASVVDFVRDGDNQIKQAFESFMEDEQNGPGFVEGLLKFYPKEKIAEAMVRKPAPARKEAEVRVVMAADKEALTLPREKKLKLMQSGYAIMDNRPDAKHTRIYQNDYNSSFTNPGESGLASYLTNAGELRSCLVLLKPMNLKDGFSTDECVVVDLDGDNAHAYLRDIKDVLIKHHVKPSEMKTILDKLQDPAEAKPAYDKYYMLVSETLASVGPIRICQNYKSDTGLRHLVVERCGDDYEKHGKHFNRFFEQPSNWWAMQFNKDNKTNCNVATLVFSKKTGLKLEHVGDKVMVPKGFKLLPITREGYDFTKCHQSTSVFTDGPVPTPATPSDGEVARKEERKRRQEYCDNAPGNRGGLTAALGRNHVYPMTIRNNGGECFVSLPGINKKFASARDAKIGLVLQFGFAEKTAEELVDSLVPTITKKALVKLAVLGDQTLPLYDEQPEYNQFGQPTYYGLPWEQIADTSDHYTGQPDRPGLAVTPDDIGGSEIPMGKQQSQHGHDGGDPFHQDQQSPAQQGQSTQGVSGDIGQAAQMAQSGQKEIFDTQSIATLAKYVNGPEKLSSYLPSMIACLDKIGRTLFLLNWETDKFKDVVGADELPEFMETAKNVMENLGNLVLQVRRANPGVSLAIPDNADN